MNASTVIQQNVLKRVLASSTYISHLQHSPDDLVPLLTGVLKHNWVSPQEACKVLDALVRQYSLDLTMQLTPGQRFSSSVAELAASCPLALKHLITALGLDVNTRLTGDTLLIRVIVAARDAVKVSAKRQELQRLFESFRVLLSAGADPNLADADCETPLELVLGMAGVSMQTRELDRELGMPAKMMEVLFKMAGALLPLTTSRPFYSSLPVPKELKRPVKDVTNDLVQLSRCPDQVPSPRVQLLMAALGRRLHIYEPLLQLLPLTAVHSYVGWFQDASDAVCTYSAHEAEMEARARGGGLPEEKAGMSYSGCRKPISDALLTGFKEHLQAHPHHLGLYPLMWHSETLMAHVCGDAGCWPALARLPGTLLAVIQAEHGGVVPRGLWAAALTAANLVVDIIGATTAGGRYPEGGEVGVHPCLAGLADAGYWRDLMRLIGLPLDPGVHEAEAGLLAKAMLSLCQLVSCRAQGRTLLLLPEFVEELTGAAQPGMLRECERLLKRLLKASRAGRPLDLYEVQALNLLLNPLSRLAELEQPHPTLLLFSSAETGLSQSFILQVLQPRVQAGMAALRASGLWTQLQELQQVAGARHIGAEGVGRWGCLNLLLLGKVLGTIPFIDVSPPTHELASAASISQAEAEAKHMDMVQEAARSRRLKQLHEACSHCGRPAAELPVGSKLSACAGCKAVKYCGRDCQLAHWKGGHKKECIKSTAGKKKEACIKASKERE